MYALHHCIATVFQSIRHIFCGIHSPFNPVYKRSNTLPIELTSMLDSTTEADVTRKSSGAALGRSLSQVAEDSGTEQGRTTASQGHSGAFQM